MVPVLSEHKIRTSPKLRMDQSFLTITFFFIIVAATDDIATVIMAGSSSGAIPTASARET
jgi:hypothetical protein